MPVTSMRRAFTLIELILVITIMGVIAAMVSSRLSGVAEHSVKLTPVTLKHYLSAFNSSKRLDLLCYDDCTRCDLWEGEKKKRSGIVLESTSPLSVHQFDHFGRLIAADLAIRSDADGMRSGCFQFSLYPNGITTPLILKIQGGYLAYTPLSAFPISGSEEQIRTLLYDTTLMKAGSYYGSQ